MVGKNGKIHGTANSLILLILLLLLIIIISIFYRLLYLTTKSKKIQENRAENYYLFIIITLWDFFISALADGLLHEIEWQKVSSSLQDSSQYSGRYQLCSSLDGLHSSCYFRVLHYYYCYHYHYRKCWQIPLPCQRTKKKPWNLRLTMTLVVTGEPETIPKHLDKILARTLSRVLDTWGELLFLILQW